MSDYKDILQGIFEEMVWSEYGHTEYWRLDRDEQSRLYQKAQREYADRMADSADYLRKKEREG